MVEIGERDRQILGFIAARGEVFFKELEESNIMAKSTLSKHLREMRENGLIEKTISKKRNLGPHDVVYILTSKGRKLCATRVRGRHLRLEDVF
jgi:DNA-binding HxlR family transcriptional regulator